MNTVRAFTAHDVELGMRLKAAANWNQTEADWRRVLELEPTGCFVGLCDDAAAATLTTAVFGDTAWIAMVLTDPAFRGRGLATTLMRRAIEYLECRGVRSMRLDATALGKPVYEKFGFRVVAEETRFFGVPLGEPVVGLRTLLPLSAETVSAAAQLDTGATGNDRGRLLSLLRRDWPAAAFVTHRSDRDELDGFVLARKGSRAVQIGPCIARTSEAGMELLAVQFGAAGSMPVYVDVPNGNVAARDFVRGHGLNVERAFFRMTRGDDVPEREQEIWANCGPEFG